MLVTKAYAAHAICAPLQPFQIERREPGPNDVLFDILYCGICHTDVHLLRGEFPGPLFPMVPGHEIVGRVVRVGDAVRKFAVGDTIGVGCMVDSCRHCTECLSGEEHFCAGIISTSNAYEKDGKTRTYGGFSTRMTVDQAYVLKLPASLDPARAAPLLCAGITTYSPLRHWKVGTGTKIGIVGLGGLGHIGVKLAVALGAEVTVFSRSDSKREDARRLGAADFAATDQPQFFARFAGQFDLILNTVSGTIDCDAYVSMLKRDGTLVMLGIADGQLSVNSAFDRIVKGDVKYRFVIDMASLR
jgi:uncharacterized zinc-type alcohol dehydrogenase-like protein